MSGFVKVINGLECCKIPFTKCYAGGCSYYEKEGCKDHLKSDALVLLRRQHKRIQELELSLLTQETAQTPRLLSLEDVKQLPMGATAWREYRWRDEDDGITRTEISPVMRAVCCGVPVLTDGESQEPLENLVPCEGSDITAERYWTARPTEEQRKAVPWDD